MAQLYIALPVMNEPDTLPRTVKCIQEQDYADYKVVVCVNQPDEWWNDMNEVHYEICKTNTITIDWLSGLNDSRFFVIDKSSMGSGWTGKNHGIGWARKTIFDHILTIAGHDDLILSLDADTTFNPGYFGSVIKSFSDKTQFSALSVPYYHQLTGNEEIDRSILHYEIYMRSYLISLFLIDNPYAFTALGSAICARAGDVKVIGGMTPKLSGEDFYFLQKLAKYKPLLHWNDELVYPAARLSDRVYFGTGPALIKGIKGDWDSYPVYPFEQFLKIKETYSLFGKLFEKDFETPMDDFLKNQSGELPWQSLRENCKTVEKFEKACIQKIDGLRILQFLKQNREFSAKTDEQLLAELFTFIYENHLSDIPIQINDINFSKSTIQSLDYIRNALFNTEQKLRKSHYNKSINT